MRSGLVRFLDWLAIACLVATGVIYFSGGLVIMEGERRVFSTRSYDRAFLLMLAVVGIRLLIDRHHPPPWWVSRLATSLKRLWAILYAPQADAAVASPRPGRWRRRALALAGFCAFAAIMLHVQLQHMYGVTDLGDPLFSVWRLGWVHHQLQGDPRSLFDGNIYYPAPFTLTFSDSMLLPALINAGLVGAGLHPVVAYNTLLVGSFVASALACYLLAEELTGSSGAAFIAGLLYGFHPFHYEHYSHLELLMSWWMPLALLAIHRFIATTRVIYAVLAALLTTAQLYSSMYLAVFFLWFAAVTAGVLCWCHRPPVRKMLVGAAAGAIVALVLAVPLYRAYSSARLHDRSYEEVVRFSAELSDYLRSHNRSALWAGRPLPDPQPERGLFPGAVMLVLAAIALWPPLGKARLPYAAALLLITEITRGSNGFLYPELYKWLAFMRGMRVPARASLLVGMALAILAAFAVSRLLRRVPRPWPVAVVCGLTVLIGVDLFPALQLEQVWRHPPSIYQALAGRRDVVLAEFPLGLSPGAALTDMPHMYFSVWHGANLINGYSGHAPDGYGEFQDKMRPFPEPPTIELLKARGATHVTVNCALYREGCEALLSRLETVPELHVLMTTRWQGRTVRLYELTR